MTCRNGGDCLDPDLCHCAWADTDCITVAGSGNPDNPFTLSPRVDASADSIVECGAAGMGVFVPEDIDDPPATRMRSTSDQTIPNKRDTALNWDAFRFNTRNLYDFKDSGTVSTTAGKSVRLPLSGIYVFHVSIRWDTQATSTGVRRISLLRNNETVIVHNDQYTEQLDPFAQSFTMVWSMKALDTVSVWAYQDSGGSRTIKSTSPLTPEFAIVYRGPTLSPPSQN